MENVKKSHSMQPFRKDHHKKAALWSRLLALCPMGLVPSQQPAVMSHERICLLQRPAVGMSEEALHYIGGRHCAEKGLFVSDASR